ncbi:MAG: hypothetical protein J3K34DRAFT_516869 [Monoraphidium minutum]|nr:MAG: hypothetical protein J3K34DRAFT_516869 [Monoraphidium minutum]
MSPSDILSRAAREAPPTDGGSGSSAGAAAGRAEAAGAGGGDGGSPRLALSFTGGKDCMLALHLLSGYSHPSIPFTAADLAPAAAPAEAETAAAAAPSPLGRVVVLATFGPPPAPGERPGSSFKAHPIAVMEAQAAALGLPLEYCEVGAPYQERYASEMVRLRERYGVTGLVTGDIEDVAGGFMAAAAARARVRLITPLWQLERGRLLRAVVDLGLATTISCVALAKFCAAPPPGPTAAPEAGADASDAAAEGGAAAEGQQQAAVAAAAASQASQTAGQQQQQQQQQAQAPDPTTPAPAAASACHCHCIAAPPRLGPPLFDAVGELLGRQITPGLAAGAIARAAAAVGIDAVGEDGSFHTIVTACPLFRGARLALRGGPHVDAGSGYAYMVYDEVSLERP